MEIVNTLSCYIVKAAFLVPLGKLRVQRFTVQEWLREPQAELLNEQGQATTVRTIDYAAGAGAARWLQAVESVQPAAGTTTVRLRFRLVATATNVLTGLDAIHLFDARQGDLGVRLSTTPKVVKGIAAHARVTVQNLSAQTLNTFSLKVSAGHQPLPT